jgi:hypothetical protein
VAEPRYVPPPAFAPPELRVAPLNEIAVLGGSSYPVPEPQEELLEWRAPRPDASARRHRLTSVVVSLSVVAALAVIAAVLVSNGTGAKRHTLSLPDSVGAYTRMSTLRGAQVESLFSAGSATFRGVGLDDLDGALVGVYGALDDTQPSMLFIGFRADDSPTIGSGLHGEPAADVAAQVLDQPGSTIAPQSVDAGPLGGAMRCATVVLDGALASVGVWADHDTLGIVLLDDSSLTAHSASASNQHTGVVTRQFRAAAEH